MRSVTYSMLNNGFSDLGSVTAIFASLLSIPSRFLLLSLGNQSFDSSNGRASRSWTVSLVAFNWVGLLIISFINKLYYYQFYDFIISWLFLMKLLMIDCNAPDTGRGSIWLKEWLSVLLLEFAERVSRLSDKWSINGPDFCWFRLPNTLVLCFWNIGEYLSSNMTFKADIPSALSFLN